MYEFHGWFRLGESTYDDDVPRLQQVVSEVEAILAGLSWTSARFHLGNLNGEYFLTMTGLPNRRRDEAAQVDALLALIAEKLPGSYGLLYEQDDEMPVPPGPNAFRVRVLARGRISLRLDPFLSPTIPTTEDELEC
jgi:hypothetical protein